MVWHNRLEMKTAIVHYHLHPGGVTRIIGSQVQGLLDVTKGGNLVVLCGNNDARTELAGVPILELPCLQYLPADKPDIDLEKEAATIISRIKEHAEGFILHCHNPNLGKNPALTLALYQLARERYRIVNHCHDFAEDRPLNLETLNRMAVKSGLIIHDVLYPDFPGYHFVVLNSADYKRILDARIPEGRVHLVPNPVSVPANIPETGKSDLRRKIIEQLSLAPDRNLCTYPVRAINRKNIGELILLGVLFEDTCQFLVTQAPKNPDEIPGYERWKELCTQQGIRIKFEAGDVVNHEELIGISDFCITTSTREGFGMVFLEPWVAGTPVSGRDLPGITGDLRNFGLEFPGLYKQILVESGKGICDFAEIGREGQEDIITRARSSLSERNKIHRLNPFLGSLFTVPKPGVLEKNREIILKHFSVSSYGQKLLEIYKALPQ